MFAYDVLGFQTSSDAANFVRYVVEQADGEALQRTTACRAFGRTVIARAFPIGIDVDAVYEMAHTPEADAHIGAAAAPQHGEHVRSSASTGSTIPRACRIGCAPSAACSSCTPNCMKRVT